MIKAALTAGLYPNVAFQPSEEPSIFAHEFGQVKIDTEKSVLEENPEQHWYIFDQRKENKISGITVVSPITIFLFAGPNRLQGLQLKLDTFTYTSRGEYFYLHPGISCTSAGKSLEFFVFGF